MAGTRNPKSPSRQSSASPMPRRCCASWPSLDLPNATRQKHGMRRRAERPAASTPFRIARVGSARCPDPDNPFWIVMRAGDKTSVLSRHEERVLSAVPRDYATDAVKIRIAAGVPEVEIAPILERLLVRRLIEASDGLRGGRV